MGKNGSFSIECKDILYSGVCRLEPSKSPLSYGNQKSSWWARARVMVFNAIFNNISIIVAVSFIVGWNRITWRKLYHKMLYRVQTSPWAVFEVTTLLVIATDCTCSCKSSWWSSSWMFLQHVSDCYLTPTRKYFCYIMARASSFSMKWWWVSLCYRPTRLVGFL
jgi:hypothetical protein